MSAARVVRLDAAFGRAAGWRAEGRRVGLILGAFDLLSAGHARAVLAARGAADRLVAGVRDDATAGRILGRGRPVLAEAERARLVAALRGVDLVVIVDEAAAAALETSLGAPADADRGGGAGDALPDVVARVRALHGRGGAGA